MKKFVKLAMVLSVFIAPNAMAKIERYSTAGVKCSGVASAANSIKGEISGDIKATDAVSAVARAKAAK